MGITRWSIPKSDWLYSLQLKMEKLYIVSKNKTGSWLWLRSWSTYCKVSQFSCSVMSNTLWSHGLRPTRLLHPWDFPGKIAGVGCHWSNRQIWPWSTEWSRPKAYRVLPREHTGHSKHPLPTTQEKTLYMDITRWLTLKSDWLYSLQPKMEKLYIVSKNKTGSWLWLRSWTPYCQIQT